MKDMEQTIHTYLAERGWHTLRPADLAKSISIEAGELLEIFQWSSQTLAEVKGDAEKLARIRGELADVLLYCLDMSVLLELDTEAIIREKLEKIKKKYPAELFVNSGVAEPGTEEVYHRIKREHRMRGE